jgi:hypothetical protein
LAFQGHVVFWHDFPILFYNLDLFINTSNICFVAKKISSFDQRMSKFTPKKFYEIDPLFHSPLNDLTCNGSFESKSKVLLNIRMAIFVYCGVKWVSLLLFYNK